MIDELSDHMTSDSSLLSLRRVRLILGEQATVLLRALYGNHRSYESLGSYPSTK